MTGRRGSWISEAARAPRTLVAVVPALALLAYALADVWGLVVLAAGAPVLALPWARSGAVPSGPLDADGLRDQVDARLRKTRLQGGVTCLLMLEFQTDKDLNRAQRDGIAATLRAILRDGDEVHPLADGRMAVLASVRRGLSATENTSLARRLQTAVEMPLVEDDPQIKVQLAVGLASSPRPGQALTATGLIEAAQDALHRARRHGPSGLVSADPPARPRPVDMSLVIEARRALDTDQIVPWYQPQVCARTGALMGVEALARWEHPERGVISPGGFLPALEQAGVSARLGEVMLHHACAALQAWQAAGLRVPTVALNLSEEELSIPGLAQRIAWDLEAQNITPDRLRIEILETVATSSADGTPGQNIAALRALGCPIDLDDFGTGNATITAVERFGVDRLKIDRSFVTGIDKDLRQQRLVSAVIAMADHMGVDTLAEGIETEAELQTLSDLGCSQAQGYVIARPMPLPALMDWARVHAATHHLTAKAAGGPRI